MLEIKRTNGQYFTEVNPFNNIGFLKWAELSNLKNSTILEPFAGSNNLIKMLQQMDLCSSFVSYDIHPKDNLVATKNTLLDFPIGYKVCITNPPYLAKNSAKRQGFVFPETSYDDLYKLALSKCLENCDYVAAIIPASFLNTHLFRSRLSDYVLITDKLFNETFHPVCLALFKPNSNDVDVFEQTKYLGKLSYFESMLPIESPSIKLKFNDPTGSLGLIAIDNTLGPSIRFCKGSDLCSDKIRVSSRSITRISLDAEINTLLPKLNKKLKEFREDTHDLFLTPFKSLRKDNRYRRRLDYSLAKALISSIL